MSTRLAALTRKSTRKGMRHCLRHLLVLVRVCYFDGTMGGRAVEKALHTSMSAVYSALMLRRWTTLAWVATYVVTTISGTLVLWSQEPVHPSTPGGAKRPSLDELLLFFPAQFPAGNWSPSGLRYQDVWFNAADKTRLHGWYCPCDHPRAIILIAHGNAGHVAFRTPWLRYLQSQARVATLMFDYRGYGRSEGAPTVEGILDDAKAARAKLRELAAIKDDEMLLMGESLGGAVVVQLAAESTPRGVILQSTFSSLKDVADVHFPRLSWLVPQGKLNSATQLARYHGPLLQSHGTADDTIPFGSGDKLFRAANEPKEFVEIPGAGHNNWLTAQYLTRLDQFFTRLPPVEK
jgi:uncharacterized protein